MFIVQEFSKDLCNALAALTHCLCTEFVDPSSIAAFFACRLIPLKNPGVRPIGVCEAVRRIIGKVVISTLQSEIQSVAGVMQLCAGQKAGCEAAIHSMRSVFANPDTDGVLLVDATNAFNSLNHQVALTNISILCPAMHPILVNAYRRPSYLFMGGETVLSQEGTTHDDPLAMAMHALATVPLIDKVKTNGLRQVWYADDAAGGGKLASLRQWWNNLSSLGRKFVIYPTAVNLGL